MKATSTRKSRKEMTGRDFDALTGEQKQKIAEELESKTTQQHIAESRPLTARERREFEQLRRRGSAGRPKLGPQGVKVISLSVERGLLKRADAYAARLGLKRAEFISDLIRNALKRET